MDEDPYWEFQENIKPILLRSPTKSKTNITFRPSPQNTIININSVIFFSPIISTELFVINIGTQGGCLQGNMSHFSFLFISWFSHKGKWESETELMNKFESFVPPDDIFVQYMYIFMFILIYICSSRWYICPIRKLGTSLHHATYCWVHHHWPRLFAKVDSL